MSGKAVWLAKKLDTAGYSIHQTCAPGHRSRLQASAPPLCGCPPMLPEPFSAQGLRQRLGRPVAACLIDRLNSHNTFVLRKISGLNLRRNALTGTARRGSPPFGGIPNPPFGSNSRDKIRHGMTFVDTPPRNSDHPLGEPRNPAPHVPRLAATGGHTPRACRRHGSHRSHGSRPEERGRRSRGRVDEGLGSGRRRRRGAPMEK